VHIVDDDASFATAMERRLKHAGYDVMTHPSALHFLVNLPIESVPSCIILDVRLPGLDGPTLQKRLAELGSTLPIIFLTGYTDIPTTVQAIKAGADDFLTKPVNSEDLFPALERAFAHHKRVRDLRDKLGGIRARLGRLTPRERQVFDLVVRGNINKQIAHTLGATERTIKAHRHRVMEKMQVQTLAELVSLAERVGAASATDGPAQQFSGRKLVARGAPKAVVKRSGL
jgi:FixJ family two-component response regulator